VSIIQAIVLGAVQGLTEFIPISSSGHLVVVPALLGWREPGLVFDVLLHVGSLLALLVYFWSDLMTLLRGLTSGDRSARRLLLMLVVASIPAAIAGLLLASYFEDQFTDAKSAALQLLLTAVILVAAERLVHRNERRAARTGAPLRSQDDMTVTGAVVVGVAQAIAIVPGISRSGSTIGAGLFLGMGRDEAARFAFLLAIPALFGAALVQLPDIASANIGLGAGIAGSISSLLFSYIAVAALIRYLKSNTLYPFAAYTAVAAVIFYVLL
jgi:undecaprenyl-diphosphatase